MADFLKWDVTGGLEVFVDVIMRVCAHTHECNHVYYCVIISSEGLKGFHSEVWLYMSGLFCPAVRYPLCCFFVCVPGLAKVCRAILAIIKCDFHCEGPLDPINWTSVASSQVHCVCIFVSVCVCF